MHLLVPTFQSTLSKLIIDMILLMAEYYTKPPLVQIMTYRLLDAKPQSDALTDNWYVNEYENVFCKMAAILCQLWCITPILVPTVYSN